MPQINDLQKCMVLNKWEIDDSLRKFSCLIKSSQSCHINTNDWLVGWLIGRLVD